MRRALQAIRTGGLSLRRERGWAPRPPSLHHVTVEIRAGQLKSCLSFYKDILGLQELETPVKHSLWFAEGVHLYWGGRGPTHMQVDIPASHFALVLGRKYDMVRAKCKRGGWFLTDGSMYWGSPRCFVHDPGDNRIELMQFPPQ